MKDHKWQDMQDRAYHPDHHAAYDPAFHVFPYPQHIFFHGSLQDKVITLKEL